MANPKSTNTGELPTFTALKDSERRAVILRAEGRSIEQITANINDEFAHDYSPRTVKEWFSPGGRLKQAFDDYNEAMAVTSLQEARQLIKRATKAAAANMIAKIKSMDEGISLKASQALLNKYIPDRQVSLDHIPQDEALPPELAEIADSLNDEEAQNGPQQVDDSSMGGSDNPETGA